MTFRNLSTTALVVLTVVCAGSESVTAQTPSGPNCLVGYWGYPNWTHPVSLHIRPDGLGWPLTHARIIDISSSMVNGTIYVTLKSSSNQWCKSYPANDIWIESITGGIAFCTPHGAIADGPTWSGADNHQSYQSPPYNPDDPGRTPDFTWSTTISGPFYGGGHSNLMGGGDIAVYTASTGVTPLPAVPGGLNLHLNSTDINGDLVVNLLDISLFVADFFSGIYDYRSDFHPDGAVNLADVAILAAGVGAHCP